jgi:4-hydroxy-tetrahydrodipicolinate reductase
MNIALVGYGKMGQAIEKLAIQVGHTISFKINIENANDIQLLNKSNTDVAIEFTGPDHAYNNVTILLNKQIPTVSGSTGWNSNIKVANALALQNNTSFIWASNYSLGVNLFFAFTEMIAAKMAQHPSYQVKVHEIHHTAKIDAPSGTAITTAEHILKQYPNKTGWTDKELEADKKLYITHDRIDPYPGLHEVLFKGEYDEIKLTHNAQSRIGFAQGAVLAAEYIVGKTGIFTMKDVLSL